MNIRPLHNTRFSHIFFWSGIIRQDIYRLTSKWIAVFRNPKFVADMCWFIKEKGSKVTLCVLFGAKICMLEKNETYQQIFFHKLERHKIHLQVHLNQKKYVVKNHRVIGENATMSTGRWRILIGQKSVTWPLSDVCMSLNSTFPNVHTMQCSLWGRPQDYLL